VSEQPRTCAEVTYDMAGEGQGDPAWGAEVGDLLWNPKGGYGHVLVAAVRCGTGRYGKYRVAADCGCGGWGTQPCSSMTLVCECGEDGSWRDHHYEILRRTAHETAHEGPIRG
jgi:hypothetical protein